MNDQEKTHYRKAFDSPYLSSADIVGPTILTISHVRLEKDKSKQTKDEFNTAYFVEKEIRLGEPLKPMVLNVTNSKTMKSLTGSPYIDDWNNVKVSIYVDDKVKFGKQIVEGLRISTEAPRERKPLNEDDPNWKNAIAAYKRDGNFGAVLRHVTMTDEQMQKIIMFVNEEAI